MKIPTLFVPDRNLDEKTEQLKNSYTEINEEDYEPVKREPGIPQISDMKLEDLYKRIKPVVRHEGNLHYIKDVDLRRVAFTWDPKLTTKAENLERICDITTYHRYGYYGLFKPSIAEVIAQIPEKCLDRTVAFETSTDLDIENIVGEYHVTTTTLYKRR